MIERGGRLRFRHLGKGSGNVQTVKPLLHEHVSRDVERVITDESAIYPFAFDGYCAKRTERVHVRAHSAASARFNASGPT